MKLGFVSACLGNRPFEEVIDIAARLGYECVEVSCWPQGKPERRYAGVSHLDVNHLTDEEIHNIKSICQKKNVEISALGYYPNILDSNLAQRKIAVDHLMQTITAANKLGVDTVTTFLGRMPDKNVDENLKEMMEVWPEIIRHAEESKVKIAIENCPMLFGPEQWPGGQNLFATPFLWRKIFKLLPSENLGINYDPSHFIWQHIDYIKPIYEFRNKIFHVHIKDIKLHTEKLDDIGIMGYPLDFMSPKLPGLGDVNWGKYISALKDIGYDGYACVEEEDRAFEGSNEKIINALELSRRYMLQFVI